MQTAFKIIIISVFIALVSYGVGLLLKGSGSSSNNKPGNSLNGSGILYSEDKGDTWTQKTNTTLGQNISRFNITVLSIQPKDSTIVFAGTDSGGLYRSKDSGSSWEILGDNKVLSQKAMVRDIALDPQDPQRLFVAVFQNNRGRILRSQDQGNTFEETYFTSRDKIGVNAVILGTQSRSQVFIANDDGLVLQSSDNGSSWRTIGTFATPVRTLAQTKEGLLLAVVASRGLLRSNDNGDHWFQGPLPASGGNILKPQPPPTPGEAKKLEMFQGGNDIQYLVIDPRDSSTLYLGTAYGLLRSHDGGILFDAPPLIIPAHSLPVMSIGIDPFDSRTLLVGAGQALYRSEDGGDHWSVHPVLTTKRLRVMSIFPNDDKKLLIGLGK